jgi:hypothetical protein
VVGNAEEEEEEEDDDDRGVGRTDVDRTFDKLLVLLVGGTIKRGGDGSGFVFVRTGTTADDGDTIAAESTVGRIVIF